MNNIVCSMAVKKGVVAILIVDGGMMKSRAVERIKDDEVAASSYASIIYAFKMALRHVRDYIQKCDDDCSVCFETSNSTFVKWVESQYSKPGYQTEFMEALHLLQELPILYAFHYAPKPKALVYADASYCKKEKLSGLDLFVADTSGSMG